MLINGPSHAFWIKHSRPEKRKNTRLSVIQRERLGLILDFKKSSVFFNELDLRRQQRGEFREEEKESRILQEDLGGEAGLTRCKLVPVRSNADSRSVTLTGDTVSPTSPSKHSVSPPKQMASPAPRKMCHILPACRRRRDAIHENENPVPWGDTRYACVLDKCVCTSCKTIAPLPFHCDTTHTRTHTLWLDH